jgi:hypothetical protein
MRVSGQRHALTALYPKEGTPGIHYTGGWVGPSASLDTKSLAPAGDRTPIVQPVVRHYTAWANPAMLR